MYQEEEKLVNEEVEVSNEAKKEVKPDETSSNKPEEKKEASKPSKKVVLDPNECHDLEIKDNPNDVIDQIEMKRRTLLASFNKSRLISRISMAVVVAAVIGAIIMIFNNSMVLKIIGYSLAGVVLIAMIVYYVISKDKFPKQSKAYISEVTELINKYDFDDPRFSELKVYPNKKLSKTELEVDRVYKNAAEIGSRNFITGKFDGHKFEVSENVLYSVSQEKKNQRSVAFLGKYVSIENKHRFEGRYIFNLRGQNKEKLVDQPNDIDDLKVVLEEDNLVVYAPNEKPIKEVFGTKFISNLKEIKTDDKLLNFIIVIWAGHTAIYLSYDDSVTVLPFEKPFNNEAQDKYKDDLVRSLELALLKK